MFAKISSGGMLHTIGRVTKFSWNNIWRNGWLSVITVSTLVLTLFSVSMVLALQVGISQVVEAAEERIDLNVYFYPTATDAQLNSVITSLNAFPGVTAVTYVTKEQALAKYQDRGKLAPELLAPLQAIGDNPFGPSLIVRAKSSADYQRVVSELGKPQYKDLIEGQQNDFEENQAFIATFSSFTEKVRASGIVASLVFAFIAALLIFNTIRIAIYTHREEIAIMKLVGASNWFVRAPFLIEAAFYSVVALLVTAGLSLGLLYFAQPYLTSYFAGSSVNVFGYFLQNALTIFGAELLAILVINILSGGVALRRYLRV